MKAALIGVMMLVALPVVAAPGTDASIAEIQAALDKADASQARSLADAALGEVGLGARDRARLLLYRGLAEELSGAADPAAADFTAALAGAALAADERAQALLQRGFLRDGQGRLDQAAADYTAVIKLKDGGLGTALNNRANIYRRQNRLTEARRDYLAALELGRSQYAYYGLGQIAEAQHDTIGARGFYARAVAVDPDYALAAQRLAALGGPPEGALADTGAIVLKPPAIVLKAPATPSRKIAARPARRAGAATAAGFQQAAPARPALPIAGEDLGGFVVLRPALDAPAAPSRGSPRSTEVQLGAWRSEAEARAGWAKAQARAGGVLDGLEPHIVAADLAGHGRYYRLRTSPSGSATAFCARLAGKGISCFAARN